MAAFGRVLIKAGTAGIGRKADISYRRLYFRETIIYQKSALPPKIRYKIWGSMIKNVTFSIF
jgi:hypothetical protein